MGGDEGGLLKRLARKNFRPRLVSDFGSSTGGPGGNGARDSLKTLRGGPETAGNPRHRARAAENEPLRAPLERRSPERMGAGPSETGADPGAAGAELELEASSCRSFRPE